MTPAALNVITSIVARGGYFSITGDMLHIHGVRHLDKRESSVVRSCKAEIVAAMSSGYFVVALTHSAKAANPMSIDEIHRHMVAEGWVGADELLKRGVAA